MKRNNGVDGGLVLAVLKAARKTEALFVPNISFVLMRMNGT